jgi:starch synthase
MISAALDIQGERAQQRSVNRAPSVFPQPTDQRSRHQGADPVASQNPNKKKVLFVTSEIADLVKTGGLGDVSAALPRAMAPSARCARADPRLSAGDAIARNPIHIIGELRGMPRCRPARSAAWTCPTVWSFTC